MRTAATLTLLLCALAAPALAADPAPDSERLRVVEPYIELHTGPGRGFPVFHVAARHEWIVIELRHTDWFKVRTENGRVGWVPRAQLERTVTEAGGSKSFRDVLVDDYLKRRVEMGAAWGRFKGEPLLKVWAAYRWADAISLEASAGQVQGVFSGSDLWHVNLSIEPWSDQRLSPALGVGLGKFRNVPNRSLVDAVSTDAQLAVASVGLRYYISERFVGRVDYSLYTAFVADTRSIEYRAVSLGLSFFF
ncbi:MAG: hypothetical protein WAQ05_09195 [Rubrivivax sp.]